ncbi:MAG TPA: hypothetical protein VL098_06375 [Flavipsychrobacter sp.]|nr:hypothetical protein [Flavipsychrobacter sp.]
MNYKKYPDADLLESYTTSIDYSDKANKDLCAEIDKRGGIEQLRSRVREQNIVLDEMKRIHKLAFSLYKTDPNPGKIKTSITSDLLSSDQLHKTIDIAISNIEKNVKDTSINSRTIIGGIIGIAISSLIGAAVWLYSIIQTGRMYYILTPGILIVSYVIIRLLTGQSSNNALVFIATFVAAFIAIILGLWFYSLLTK